MSSSPYDRMEEDAWLMKIELKREEPIEAVKGDKSKEVTKDQAPAAEQPWPAKEEEEEDILKPYSDHLTPLRLKLFGSSKRFMCKINTLPMKIFFCKSTSSPSRASSIDWRIS